MEQKKSQETYIHRQLIFDRSAKVIKRKKDSLFNKYKNIWKAYLWKKDFYPNYVKNLLKHSKKTNNLIF